jgi:hypothetical protein
MRELQLNESEIDNILVALEVYAKERPRYERETRICIERIRELCLDTLTNGN